MLRLLRCYYLHFIHHSELLGASFAGLRVYPGGHELGGGGDYRVAGFGVDEVVELYSALRVIAGYLHDVFAVARH